LFARHLLCWCKNLSFSKAV